MLATRKFAVVACVCAAVLTLVGCASGSDLPEPESTVEMLSDYPAFDRAQLVDDATLIVEGTVTATEYKFMKSSYEPGDTSEEDPLFGLPEKEKAKALAQDKGVPTTVLTVHVDVAHQGEVKPGQDVAIVQSGGIIDGVLYREAGNVALKEGERYLLFGADSFDGGYYILGGTAGTYVESEAGTYVAGSEGSAPFETLTSKNVESITE